MSPLWATHLKKKQHCTEWIPFVVWGQGFFPLCPTQTSGIEPKIKINVATLHETIHLTELFAVLFLSYHFPFRFLLVAYLTFRKLCHDFTGLMFLRVIVQFSVFSVYFAFVEAPSLPSSKCVFFTDLFVTVTVLLVVAAQNQLIFHGFSWNYPGRKVWDKH